MAKLLLHTFGTSSLKLNGKICPMEQFFRSLPSPKGKWMKVEAYYKINQRSDKFVIDELRVTKKLDNL